jgi:hypothetical protein
VSGREVVDDHGVGRHEASDGAGEDDEESRMRAQQSMLVCPACIAVNYGAHLVLIKFFGTPAIGSLPSSFDPRAIGRDEG